MGNKDSKDKIHQFGFWAFCVFFGYLVVAFFLLSDYPIHEYPFNQKRAYEALKDALTITTPIIAVILVYIIWHTQKKKEVYASEAKILILELNKFRIISIELFNCLITINEKFNKEDAKEKIEKVKKSAFELRTNIEYFSDITGQEREFERLISELDTLVYRLKIMTSRNDWVDRFEENGSYVIIDEFTTNIEVFKKKLIKFALYEQH